jgi:geranylgeranylglycerol-phosphate geranylgeranyltransferase
MRSYLFFISGMAGWLGIIFSGTDSSVGRTTAILSVVFIGWGVNQVINDLLGLKEDKINAPHRPLVTGELPVRQAVMLSIIFFILGGFTTFLLNPKALTLFLSVFILNIIYEYSKEIPLLGNIIFGLLIAPCVYYGAMCTNNKGLEILLDKDLTFLAISVVLINFIVAFFTYYKDFTVLS